MKDCSKLVIFIVSLEIIFAFKEKIRPNLHVLQLQFFQFPPLLHLPLFTYTWTGQYICQSVHVYIVHDFWPVFFSGCILALRINRAVSVPVKILVSQSVRVYITRLLTCFVTAFFSFFRRPPFIICRLLRLDYPDTHNILCSFCIGPNPSFAIFAKVCFRVQSYGVRTLHKKRPTIFGEIWRKLSAITDYGIS